MMKRGFLLPVVFVFCSLFFVGGILYALQETCKEVYKDKLKDVMIMKSEVFKEHTKPVISFTHKKHNEEYKIDCKECHHIYEEGKNVWKIGDEAKKCGSCHNKEGKPPKDVKEKEKILYLMEAIHQNCLGCHKEVKKKDKEKDVPTACPKCHVTKKD